MPRPTPARRALPLLLALPLHLACGIATDPARSAATRAAGAALSATTGAMLDARSMFTATRLASGQVLVVGGQNGLLDQPGARCELWDPATGAWSATGSLAQARYGHVAALLPDGRVLVSGGQGPGVPATLPDEIYDPASGTWSVAGSGESRYWGAAATLADGRVLVTGGFDPQGQAIATARWYDPASGWWTAPIPMIEGRAAHVAVALADGRVLVTGGRDSSGAELASSEIFDPALNTFAPAPALAYPRSSFTATRIPDGRVAAIGGASAPAVEIYDPASAMWLTSATMSGGTLSGHLAAATADGGVLVLGGYAGGPLASALRFAPLTATWSGADPLTTPRFRSAAADLGDGRLLVAGGYLESTSTHLATAEVYTLSSGGACTPTNCAAQGTSCGAISDGCGGTLQCGTCAAGASCVANVCVAPAGPAGAPVYDVSLRAPRCTQAAAACDSASLLSGRAGLGPEADAPNTLGGTCADGAAGTYHVDESIDALRVESLDGAPLAAGNAARVTATVWAYSGYASDHLDLYYTATPGAPSWTLIATLTPVGTGAQTLSATYTLPSAGVQAIRGVFRYGGSPGACTTGPYDDHDDLVFPVSVALDVQPPVAMITAPQPAEVLSGVVPFEVTAADDVGVARVDFLVDGAVVGSASAQPYAVSWDSRTVANGPHTLGAVAYDLAGNAGSAPLLGVSTDNDLVPPAAAITAPADGAVVTGGVAISAAASDDRAMGSVELYVDGATVARLTAPPYVTPWSSRSVRNGSHAITCKAYDQAGNVAACAPVTIATDNDLTAPVVEVTSPGPGATVSGTVTVSASASDDVGVTLVEIYDGAALIGSASAPPYAVAWSTASTAANGAHTLTALAYDASGNVGKSAAVTVNVANASSGVVTAAYDATLRAPACATVGSGCDSGTLLVGRAQLGPEANAPDTIGASCADGTAGTFHYDESLDRLSVSTLDGSALAAGKTVRVDATVWAYSAYSYDSLDLFFAPDAANPVWTLVVTLPPAGAGAQTLTATYVLPAGVRQAVRGRFRYGGVAAPCGSGAWDDQDDLAFVVR